MEFQNTNKIQQMFEDIKKNILDICYEPIIEDAMKLAKEYDDFLLHEFEKRGYTLDELQSGKHKLEKEIQPMGNGEELHQFFIDDKCVLVVLTGMYGSYEKIF